MEMILPVGQDIKKKKKKKKKKKNNFNVKTHPLYTSKGFRKKEIDLVAWRVTVLSQEGCDGEDSPGQEGAVKGGIGALEQREVE